MDIASVIQGASAWLSGAAGAIVPQYIVPNISLILQIVLIVAVAYIAGRLGKFLTTRLLSMVGIKRLAERSWTEGVLRVTGYKGSVVELISDLVKWLIYIMFFTILLQILGLSGAADILGQVAIFVPRFIGALLLIVVGFIIADFFGKIFAEAGSRFMGAESFGSFTGGLVKYTIGMVVLIMSLALIGLDISALAILLCALLVMVIIIATIGMKDILPEVTAGIELKGSIKPGEHVKVSGYSGVVDSIEPLVTKIKTRGAMVLIPNTIVAGAVIEKPVASGGSHRHAGARHPERKR